MKGGWVFVYFLICFILGSNAQNDLPNDDKITGEESCGCNQLNREKLLPINSKNCEKSSEYSCNSGDKPYQKLAAKESTINDKKIDQEEDDEDVDIEVESGSEKNTAKLHVSTNTAARDVLRINKMVRVIGGTFWMGTAQQFIPADGEGPLRQVTVKDFYIDQREVSNAEFEQFIKSTHYVTEVSQSLTCK